MERQILKKTLKQKFSKTSCNEVQEILANSKEELYSGIIVNPHADISKIAGKVIGQILKARKEKYGAIALSIEEMEELDRKYGI